MIDPRKTVELHEVEEGYFRGITGDLASNNEELKAENHRLAEQVAELEAESTAFLSFVIARINAIIVAGGSHNDMINDLCRLKDYLEGEAE